MSSRFADFFVASKTGDMKTWMIQVNSVGDAVVYRIDGEGRPSAMACGPIVDTVLDSLACAMPNVVIHLISKPDRPDYYGFRVDTWAELLDVLAGRSRPSRRAETRRLWDRQISAKYTPLPRYVSGVPWHYSDLQLTQEAIAADVRFLAERDAERRRVGRLLDELEAKHAARNGNDPSPA